MANARRIWYAFLLLILLLGLVRIIVGLRGLAFWLEALGVLGLVLLSFAGFLWLRRSTAPLFGVFVLYLLNLILLWLYTGKLYFILLVIALIGFFTSLPRARTALPAMIPAAETKAKAPKEVPPPAPSASKVAATHVPGKYVASRSSNVYHEPKCDWAKKIQKPRQVWFNDKKEAYAQGFRKHGCVQ